MITIALNCVHKNVVAYGLCNGKFIFRKESKIECTPDMLAKYQNEPHRLGLPDTLQNHALARQLNEYGFSPEIVRLNELNGDCGAHGTATQFEFVRSVCIALMQPDTVTIAVQNCDEHEIVCLHQARQHLRDLKLAQAREISSLAWNYCLRIPNGTGYIEKRLPQVLEDQSNLLSPGARVLLQHMLHLYMETGRQLAVVNHELKYRHTSSQQSREYALTPGVGPIRATALLAARGRSLQINQQHGVR